MLLAARGAAGEMSAQARRDRRRLVSIIGEGALSDRDRSYLGFAHDFEQRFVHRGGDRRTIAQTSTPPGSSYASYMLAT